MGCCILLYATRRYAVIQTAYGAPFIPVFFKLNVMKTTILFIAVFFSVLFSACTAKRKAMNNNNLIATCIPATDRGGQPMLWGRCLPQSLKQPPYAAWFNSQYNNYVVDAGLIKQLPAGFRAEIFMGTWCGDSKREVPRMLKMLEQASVPVTLYTVSNHDSAYKQTPGSEAAQAAILRVPTLIIYDAAEKETGRIIESPVQTLEKDLLTITGGTYQPRYEKAQQLLQLCRLVNENEFEQKISSAVNELRDSSFNSGVLNNIIYVLMAGGNVPKAGMLVKMNEQLFPGDVFAQLGKARYLRYCGKTEDAAGCCREILQKDPQNAMAKEILASLNK
jgi:thiol-disulfide isomerase/thioredoxin